MKIKKVTAISLALLCCPFVFGQTAQQLQTINTNWFCGNSEFGIHFDPNNGFLPQLQPANLKYTPFGGEGAAVATDYDGDLLFYSDGLNVISNDGSVMQGGANIGGFYSGAQAAAICPKTDACNQYYLFNYTPSGQLMYRVVDMTQNNGLGSVISGPTLLISPTVGEAMVVIPGANPDEFWLTGKIAVLNKYYSFHIVNGAIDPLIQLSLLPVAPVISGAYTMTPNPAGDQVAVCGSGRVFTLNFNNVTGTFSGYQGIMSLSSVYDSEWSMDGTKLYFSSYMGPLRLYQFDLITLSTTLLYTSTTGAKGGGLKRGPDGRIYYIIDRFQADIAVINLPDNPAATCGFVPNGYNGVVAVAGLNFPEVSGYFDRTIRPDAGPDATICLGGSTPIGAPPSTDPAITYSWSPAIGLSCTDCANPTANPPVTTTYTLTVSNGFCSQTEDVTVTVTVCPDPCNNMGNWPLTAGEDTHPAEGNSIVTDAAGNVYAAGSFRSTEPHPTNPGLEQPQITVGTTTYTGAKPTDQFFVVKYDNCGDFQWIAYGDYQQYPYHGSHKVLVDVDPSGTHVYVTSANRSDMFVTDGTGVTTGPLFAGGGQAFIVEFDGGNGLFLGGIQPTYLGVNPITATDNGVYQINGSTIYSYSTGLGSAGTLNLNSLTPYINIDGIDNDANGNIFVAGSFNGTLQGVTSDPMASDLYLLKLTPSLAPIYAQKGGATGAATINVYDIYVNNQEIFVNGLFAIQPGGNLMGMTGNGTYAAKFTDLLATAAANWGTTVTASGLITGGGTDVYLMNYSGSLEHYSSVNGAALTAPPLPATGFDICFNNADNAFYLTGSYQTQLVLNTTLNAAGAENNVFIAKINATGAYSRIGTVQSSEEAAISIEKELFTVYPVPTTEGKIFVALDIQEEMALDIRMYDVFGKTVWENRGLALSEGATTLEVATTDWEAGIYFINVSAGNYNEIKKFVVVK